MTAGPTYFTELKIKWKIQRHTDDFNTLWLSTRIKIHAYSSTREREEPMGMREKIVFRVVSLTPKIMLGIW